MQYEFEQRSSEGDIVDWLESLHCGVCYNGSMHCPDHGLGELLRGLVEIQSHVEGREVIKRGMVK